jgi:hypothetical protein
VVAALVLAVVGILLLQFGPRLQRIITALTDKQADTNGATATTSEPARERW